MQNTETQSLVRKQIMLSNENIKKLDLIAKKEKSSMAHVVRKAIDSYNPGAESEDAELVELVNLLNEKLEKTLADTEKTQSLLAQTLNGLSSRGRAQ